MTNPELNKALDNAADIAGEALKKAYPANQRNFVPHQHSAEIADALTTLIAEILQTWLDAGSERDVTLEELGPVIEDHVKGWDDKEVLEHDSSHI